MARYGPRPWRHYRRLPRQRRASAGQGGMRAEFSGNQQLIRHTIPSTIPLAGAGEGYQLADGYAFAMPLVIYTGKSNNSTAIPDRSAEPTVAEGSRVNFVQTQIQITQTDSTKPNNCYIGTISTAFSDAMLNAENMDKNFAKLTIRIVTGKQLLGFVESV